MEWKRIWWIASYPKSGNTWVRLFIATYLNKGELNLNDFGRCRYDDSSSFKPTSKEAQDEIAQLLARNFCLREILMNAFPKGPVYVKTHNIYGVYNGVILIPEVVTNGGIYLIRDPRDIALSHSHHFGVSVDKSIEAMNTKNTKLFKDDIIGNYIGTWSDNVMSWTGEHLNIPVFILRYEDLLTNDEAMFKQLLSVLNILFHEEIFIKSVQACRFDNIQRIEDKEGFREKSRNQDRFFKYGKSERWKDVLSLEQIKQIESDHGKTMKQFGYI